MFEGFSSVIEKLEGSVVRVDARRRAPASGFIYGDGVIVTSNHAVESDEHIRVGLSGGTEVEATLVGRDPSTDLAVLKIPAHNLSPVSWAESSEARVGNFALALARPGERIQATLGIVRAIGSEFRTHEGGKIDRWMESDIDLPHGFSGGLLADVHGRVFGMNNSGLVRGRSVFVPGTTIQRVAESLLRGGRVQRGFLGVGSHPVHLPPKLEKIAGQTGGLIIVSVQPDGPSEQAGILLGDVLLALDGRAVTDVGALIGLLDEERIGKQSTLKILRAGELRDISVKVGSK
jgi:S1-C subfamily serine protease